MSRIDDAAVRAVSLICDDAPIQAFLQQKTNIAFDSWKYIIWVHLVEIK